MDIPTFVIVLLFWFLDFDWLHVVTLIAGLSSALFIALLDGKKIYRCYN